MYMPNFLDGFDRLVAFDAETTGKRTPDAEFIRKQPFAWRAPGIIIEVGFVEMRREGEGWRKGETWFSRVNPDGPIDPEAIKIHRIRPADLKNAPRFPTILPKVKDFIGESPIVAHAYKNERGFLDYEFARAKVIEWGESAYAEERYICTQSLFTQLFPGAIKSLTSMCDRLVLDSSERDDRHGASDHHQNRQHACPRGSRRQGASRRRPVLARLGQKCGAVDQPATLEGNPGQSLSRLPQQQTSAPPAATRGMLTHNLRLKNAKLSNANRRQLPFLG